MEGNTYMPSRAEVAGVLAALRGHPDLRGFLGSARLAMQAGLPAWAYRAGSSDRLELRRSTPNEPGTVLGVLHAEGQAPRPMVSDRGVVGRPPARPHELRNLTIRISPEMKRDITKIGPAGEVIRVAVEHYLAARQGKRAPSRSIRAPGSRGRLPKQEEEG